MTSRSDQKASKDPAGAVAAQYEPTPREQAAIKAWRDRRREKKLSPGIKVDSKKGSHVALDHPHPETASILLMEALGTTSADFTQALLAQIANVTGKGQVLDEAGMNFMLSAVKGIEPRDEIETMLATQMAAVHMATMTFARRLNHIENLPQQDSAEKAFNKLARTFTTQMEALKRYRTGGQQKVTVEHVTVQAGGQAIVGNVSHPGGGSARENEETTP